MADGHCSGLDSYNLLLAANFHIKKQLGDPGADKKTTADGNSFNVKLISY
jgi:hypothetical protein